MDSPVCWSVRPAFSRYKRWTRGFLALVIFLTGHSHAAEPMHVTYLWHMHQPIYYPYETVQQTDANRLFDRLDPARSFCIDSLTSDAGGYTITWRVVPGHTYSFESCDTLGGTWLPLPGGINLTAVSGQDSLSVVDSTVGSNTKRFYRVRLVQ